MKTINYIYTICCLLAGLYLLLPQGVNAQTMGGGSGQLQVVVNNGGTWIIYRETTSGNGSWVKQFYSTSTTIFTVKIGTTSFNSNSLTETAVASVVTGTQQYVTKRYTGTYSGNSFNVLWTVNYNTSNPDFLTVSAVIDASALPTGLAMSLAYGFDAYVNGCDGGAAITVPNLGYNTVDQSVNLTTAQVQSLHLVGAINQNYSGALLGFFPMGRAFDRAYSAYYTAAYSYNVINQTNNLFKFGPYNVPSCSGGSVWDDGVGVVFDNIPTGVITTVNTGLTFTQDLFGELDYSWNNWTNKDRTVVATAGGSNVSLLLKYNSYSLNQITGLGFQVNIPSGIALNGSSSQTGFTAFNYTGTSGNIFRVTSANIGSAGSIGNITVPIRIGNTYGQYVVDGNSISNVVKTLPLGTPATLSVTSTVNYLSNAAYTIGRNQNATYTVQLPTGIVANGPLQVNLGYTGTTASFSTLPSSVTIPSGSNSASFTVTSSNTAVDGTYIDITLSGTNHPCVSVVSPNVARVNITIPILTQPSNQTVCPGDQTTAVTFTGTNIVPAQCSWTATNGAAIGLANSGSGNIPSFTAVNTGTTNLVATFTVTPTGGDAKTFTITVYPRPALPTVPTPATICTGNTATLTATAVSGVTTDWYTTATGGTPTVTGNNSMTTPVLRATTTTITTTYYAEARNTTTGCKSATRRAVTVTVSPCVAPVNPQIRTR